MVDCADPDCLVSIECQMCSPEVCNDGLDNNCDDRIDCADPACAFDPSCDPEPEICNNGLDDDNDTLVDCDDPDCSNVPVCVQSQGNCDTAALIPGAAATSATRPATPTTPRGLAAARRAKRCSTSR